MHVHTHQPYLLQQHSVSFKIWPVIISVNTKGNNDKIGPRSEWCLVDIVLKVFTYKVTKTLCFYVSIRCHCHNFVFKICSRLNCPVTSFMHHILYHTYLWKTTKPQSRYGNNVLNTWRLVTSMLDRCHAMKWSLHREQ